MPVSRPTRRGTARLGEDREPTAASASSRATIEIDHRHGVQIEIVYAMDIDVRASFAPFADILGEGMDAAGAAEPVGYGLAAESVRAKIVAPGKHPQCLVRHGP